MFQQALREELVDTHFGALRVRRTGSGAPLLFWPSIYMDGSMWEPVAEAMAAQYEVILIDPPGHGASAPLTDIITLSDCADLVASVLTKLDLGPAVIVGNSWGGMVAIAFADAYPDLCRGIGLMNTSARAAPLWDKLYYRGLVPILRLVGFAGPLSSIALRSFLGKTSFKTRDDLKALIKERLQSLEPRSAANAALSVLIGREEQRAKRPALRWPAQP